MKKFLKKHNSLKLTQDATSCEQSCTSTSAIELVVKYFPTEEAPPNGFTHEFYHTFKEFIASTLEKAFH